MKRSEINALYDSAKACFEAHGWALPPNPRWDITDFGKGDIKSFGLILVNLAEEVEYCEKLMYCQRNQYTPTHCHQKKKEDIVCRWGKMKIQLWADVPDKSNGKAFQIQVNNEMRPVTSGDELVLNAGERITLVQGIYHCFTAATPECIIGEVSTANDDVHDNFFIDPEIGRYAAIIEDEPAKVKLLSE
jgi:D-lyxose ketol-isomerase